MADLHSLAATPNAEHETLGPSMVVTGAVLAAAPPSVAASTRTLQTRGCAAAVVPLCGETGIARGHTCFLLGPFIGKPPGAGAR